MLKMMGIVLLCVAVSLIGVVYCIKLKSRIKYLELLLKFSNQFSDEIRYHKENIFKLFDKYGQRELAFLKEISPGNISSADELHRVILSSGIDKRDVFEVADFCMRLGASDTEGQISHCKYYKDRFSSMLSEARDEYLNKGKLYRTLMFFGAAALFIILL